MKNNIATLPVTLAARCEAAIERLGLTQTAAARRIGISGTALSQWLRDKYGGDVAAVEAKVQRWLVTEHDAETYSVSDAPVGRHVELDVSEEIGAALKVSQATGDIATIVGASGTGKTWALRQHCAGRSATHYVAMRHTVRSLSGLLGVIGRVVIGQRDWRSALEAEEAVIAALQGRQALLVIDEAQFLRPTLLDELRCIRDLAECGLALAGDELLNMKLCRCPQLVGRTGMRVFRSGPSPDDVSALVSDFLGRRAVADELEVVAAAAYGAGGFHALRRVLVRAWLLAQGHGRDKPTLLELEQAAMMIVEAGGAGDAPRQEAVA